MGRTGEEGLGSKGNVAQTWGWGALDLFMHTKCTGADMGGRVLWGAGHCGCRAPTHKNIRCADSTSAPIKLALLQPS